MKQISFYDYGLEDIICGRKISTIRFKEDQFFEGETLRLIRQTGDPVGYLRILKKERVELGQLSDQDAIKENWSNIDELKKRLAFSYPNILLENSKLTRYTFNYFATIDGAISRGNNANLFEVILGKGITIRTSSQYKFDRYKKLLLSVYGKREGVIKHEAVSIPEPTYEQSPEKRALLKATYNDLHLVTPTFATDDMALIEKNGQAYSISNLKQFVGESWTELESPIQIIIRTAVAIAYKGSQNHSVVYRTFWLNTNKEEDCLKSDRPLNSYLYFDKELTSPILGAIEAKPTQNQLEGPLIDMLICCIGGTAP